MIRILVSFLLLIIVISNFILTVPLSYAQTSDVIQTQESSFPGIIAELTQCKRKKGVLTVKVRVKNTGSKTTRVYWQDAHKNAYLMDADNQKKYFILKDANGEYIYSGAPGDIPSNTSKISWFKFPAPPSEVKEITIILPSCAPFEDVPIEDK
jgi:hypothetical protein